MNKLLLSAAVLGLMTAGAAHADMHKDAKEKCYGIAKAGKNSCATANKSHSCAGHATTDNDANEWVLVKKGECESQGGKLMAPDANPAADKMMK
jgi:uncharacterized membrane protein